MLCQSDLISQQKRFPLPSLFTFLDGIFSFTSAKSLEKEIQKIAATTVADAMTPDPVSVEPDAPVEEVASLMVEKHFHTIPVVDNGRLVGVLGKEDVLKMLVTGNPSS
jgi:CBS domain-containing protein